MVENKSYAVRVQFAIEPYLTCLLDIAGGMPKTMALRAQALDEGHSFKVDEIGFYKECLSAERYAINNLMQLLAIHASEKNASKVYIWMLETIYKDQTKLSERVRKVLQENINMQRDYQTEAWLKALPVTKNGEYCKTFYEKFGCRE